jgi:hypothetical protein
VDTPKGEAPLWVREEWVGLTLPLAYGEAYTCYAGSLFDPVRRVSWFESFWSVISGKWTRWRGFVVEVNAAVAILETKSPPAAAWWRKNTPHLFGGTFLFDDGCCDPKDTPAPIVSGGNSAHDA